MTKRKEKNYQLNEMGNIIYKHRMQLSLKKKSRQYFLDDRIKKGLLNVESISEKTLSNIENGHTLPSLITLNYLSIALEVDFIELMKEVQPYIPN